MTSASHPASPSGSADEPRPGRTGQPTPSGRVHDEQPGRSTGADEPPRQPQPVGEGPQVRLPDRREGRNGWRGGLLYSVPARIGIVLALLLWVLAVYWAVTPLEVPTSQGPPFGCGTALSHPSDTFGRNVCGELNNRTALKSGTFALAGVIVLLGGFFVGASTTRGKDRSVPD
jgi:hypothetical protein